MQPLLAAILPADTQTRYLAAATTGDKFGTSRRIQLHLTQFHHQRAVGQKAQHPLAIAAAVVIKKLVRLCQTTSPSIRADCRHSETFAPQRPAVTLRQLSVTEVAVPKSKLTPTEARKLRRIQLTAVGFVILAVLALGALLLWQLAPQVSVEEDRDFVRLEQPRPGAADGPIKVTEFFTYGCVHCREFDPLIKRWQQRQADDVVLEQVAVSLGATPWRILAQTYYALQQTGALEQNHERIFSAIHDQGRQLISPEAVADLVQGRGVTREQFLEAFHSAEVRRLVIQADRYAADMRVGGVPLLLVDDTYVVTGAHLSRPQQLAVVDSLVAKVRAERAQAQ